METKVLMAMDMLAIIGGLGPWELILILVIVLIIFGAGKLPQIGDALGKGINSFRKAAQGDEKEQEEKEPTGQLTSGDPNVTKVEDVSARDVTPSSRENEKK